jgi:hypothetical protein
VRAAAVVLLALAAACGSHSTSRGLGGVVSVDGRIGDLRVGRSTADAIVAAIGRPDATARRREPGAYNPPYRMLGYGCSPHRRDDEWPLGRHAPFCTTVFFVNLRTGKLGAAYTTSPRYTESHGVRIGTSTSRAERLLHRLVYAGCEASVYLESRRAHLTIAFDGGHARVVHNVARDLIGGHAAIFVLHSPRDDVGVWDCL